MTHLPPENLEMSQGAYIFDDLFIVLDSSG